MEPATFKSLRAPLALLLLLGAFAWAVYEAQRNHRRFRVSQATHAAEAAADWYEPGATASEFSPVDLPYFLQDGFFRVRIKSDEPKVDVDLWAQDCLSEVYLDGRIVFQRADPCKACEIFSSSVAARCGLVRLSLDLGQPGKHLLAVATKNIPKGESPGRRDSRMFWIQHGSHAFGARLLALCSGVLLLALGWSRVRRGSWNYGIDAAARSVMQHRSFILIVLIALALRWAVAPGALTADVSQSAMIYAENLVNKKDLHFSRVDPPYQAAKRNGESHMHKPPGVYYQYAIPRLFFGFSDIYYIYLTRLPGVLGDLLIAWVLYTVIGARRRWQLGIAAAAFYLMGAGVFATNAMLGRIDSLPLAFLMLAAKHVERRRFPLFLGLAVAFKQLALLAVPWFLFRKATFRGVLLAGVLTLLLCAPYFLDDPKLFLERMTMPQFGKAADGLAWLRNLQEFGVSGDDVADLYRYVSLGYMLSLLVLPWLVRPDPWTALAITFCLFVLCSKSVHEHYLLWSIPPLLMSYALGERAVLGAALLVGSLTMAFFRGRDLGAGNPIMMAWSLILAATYGLAVLDMLYTALRAERANLRETATRAGAPRPGPAPGP